MVSRSMSNYYFVFYIVCILFTYVSVEQLITPSFHLPQQRVHRIDNILTWDNKLITKTDNFDHLQL